jgi:hypothetical protein
MSLLALVARMKLMAGLEIFWIGIFVPLYKSLTIRRKSGTSSHSVFGGAAA